MTDGRTLYVCWCACGVQVHPIQLVRDMVSEYLRAAMARAEAAGGVPDHSLDALLGGSSSSRQQVVGLNGRHGRATGL